MSKNLNVTINTDPKTAVTQSWWTLWGNKEPERVAVRFGNKEYVIVLDATPFFEIWTLDENGELLDLEETLQTGFPLDIERLK